MSEYEDRVVFERNIKYYFIQKARYKKRGNQNCKNA